MRRLSILAVVLVVAGCGSSGGGGGRSSALPSSLRHLFDYDRTAPLALTDNRPSISERGVILRDVSFSGARGRRVQAYLFAPAREGRFAAVVYQHGSGQNRSEFSTEAYKLARRGVVSVLLDEPWVRSGPTGARPKVAHAIRQDYVDNVVDVRRAVDLLAGRHDVDKHRIGFLGHSYGAAIGAIASGVEKRIVAYDLLSAGATPSVGYSKIVGRTAKQRKAFHRLLRTIDPVRYVRYAAPSKLFIQAGEHDELIPHADLKALIDAASKPKKVKWYNAGHELTQAAFDESAAWLARELNFK